MANIPEDATTLEGTPYDFIVVGAGAGGAPLAARLVERGYHVLVVEMGPGKPERPTGAKVEPTEVPLFHANTTEDPRHSLRYFVKHFDHDPEQSRDWKTNPMEGVPQPDRRDEEGIFYPRAQGVGGCTIHNAMITICGPSEDWDEIAESTGDESWRGERMRHYFQRVETCHYARPSLWARFKSWFTCSDGWAEGRHGTDGWLDVTMSDLRYVKQDRKLLKVVLAGVKGVIQSGAERFGGLIHAAISGRLFPSLDPNHWLTMQRSPEGVSRIPVSITPDGRRSSPRERLLSLLDEASPHKERLRLVTGVCVTQLLFDDADKQKVVGIRCLPREHVYEADMNAQVIDHVSEAEQQTLYCKKEVLLCGGTFNTPQLLMLSGIGPEEHLKSLGIEPIAHLAGVGQNLQDRYEVPIIATVTDRFRSLDGLTLSTTEADAELTRWIDNEGQPACERGIYSTNGGLIGLFIRSSEEQRAADLFIFAVAGNFPGYHVGYSTPEAQLGLTSDSGDKRRALSWIILKARTQHQAGFVQLRCKNPLRRPEINFRSFAENAVGTANPDLEALYEGVELVDRILDNGINTGSIQDYIHPHIEDFNNDKREWIKHTAWGHHAAGTCRIGGDGDVMAVLDSRLRVRSVSGLRVVDASAFPRIPGFFIVTNVYMLAEKAADTIAEDYPLVDGAAPAEVRDALKQNPIVPSRREISARRAYPAPLEAIEANQVEERRQKAELSERLPWLLKLTNSKTTAGSGQLPERTFGVALSGGGIRSATFALGIVQAMAKADWLRHVDFLSTVSGGGYTGTFLGRYFDTLCGSGAAMDQTPGTAQNRVRAGLCDSASAPMLWLRQHANYLAPGGTADGIRNVAGFFRNWLSVLFVLGFFFLTLFGLLNAVAYSSWTGTLGALAHDLIQGIAPITNHLVGLSASPWLILAEAALWLMAVPLMLTYWIVSQELREAFVPPALLATAIVALALTLMTMAPLPLLVLVASVLWALSTWASNDSIGENDRTFGSYHRQAIRSRLNRRLALGVTFTVALALVGAIDGLGRWLAWQMLESGLTAENVAAWLLSVGSATIAAIGTVRMLAIAFAMRSRGTLTLSRKAWHILLVLAVIGLGAGVPLTAISFLSHSAYEVGQSYPQGLAVTAIVLIVTLLIGARGCIPFINRSSSTDHYAGRLSRTFLGAVNPMRRQHPEGADVSQPMPGDDVPYQDYRPDKAGGPLHLINCAINQTVHGPATDSVRERQAESLAVGPAGLSVGRHWHATWLRDNRFPGGLAALEADSANPLHSEQGFLETESLDLHEWMAISGAALSPGMGRRTSLARSLLLTLANARLGYWWNSGRTESKRRCVWLRPMARWIVRRFRTQGLLLAELAGRYTGPWNRYWHLSDGGHFEVTGAYELLRRRLPFVLVCDAGEDPEHQGSDFARLIRLARIDFAAEFHEVPSSELAALNVPAEVIARLGTLSTLLACKPDSQTQAVLYRVEFPTETQSDDAWLNRQRTWLLYVKTTLSGNVSADVRAYAEAHPDFPNESTFDQVFDESQWESYRRLGEQIGGNLFHPTGDRS